MNHLKAFAEGLRFIGKKGYISRANKAKRDRAIMILFAFTSITVLLITIPVVRNLTNIYRNAYVHSCNEGHTIWVGNYISYGTNGHYGTLMMTRDPNISGPINPENLDSYQRFQLTTYSFIPAAKQIAAERANLGDIGLVWMVEAPANGSQQFLLDSEISGSVEAICWQYESDFGQFLNEISLTNETVGFELSQLIDGLGKLMTISANNVTMWEEYLGININDEALWAGELTMEHLMFINFLGERGNLGPDSGIPMILQYATIQNLPSGQPFMD